MIGSRIPMLTIILVGSMVGYAQDHTTPDQFTYRVENDIVYGSAMNYLGISDTLLLDVYTPNNGDTQRPLMVLVHGGNWLGGCKDDPSGIVNMAHQFVKRGYVVASVNYRLGWHKDDFVSGAIAGYGISPWPITYRSLYALDSAEIKRAIFRGAQDVKGAIRFMKGRAAMDSVCTEKVFVGGESAGAFVSLAAAFMDRPQEKPAACEALPDAPSPYALLLNAIGLNCVLDTFGVTPPMLARPDLGPVDGTLNLNGFDASVKGVASWYGGVPTEAFTQDWWQGVDTPAVYLYHQTCDGVVPFSTGRLFSVMSFYCNLGATPWHYNYPITRGNGTISSAFDAMSPPIVHDDDFLSCAAFDQQNPLFECARFADNGSYHATSNHASSGQNVANTFASIAEAPAGCFFSGIRESVHGSRVLLYPQPASDLVTVESKELVGTVIIRLFTIEGKEVHRIRSNGSNGKVQFDIPPTIPAGTYTVQYASSSGSNTTLMLISRGSR